MRGRIDVGVAEPARARLEGVAPFGKPVFVLVADGERATLVLPREDRVLDDAHARRNSGGTRRRAIDPASLRAVLAGCGFGAGDVAGGASYSGGVVAGRVGEARVVLRGAPGRLAAERRIPRRA